MRRLTALVLTLAVPFSAIACGSVTVKPSSSGIKAASRPPDCTVEFLRSLPGRAYEELGEIYSYFPWVAEPQNVLREKACALGADAVIVTRDFLISTKGGPDRKLVAGIAIKYHESTGAPLHPVGPKNPVVTPRAHQAMAAGSTGGAPRAPNMAIGGGNAAADARQGDRAARSTPLSTSRSWTCDSGHAPVEVGQAARRS